LFPETLGNNPETDKAFEKGLNERVALS